MTPMRFILACLLLLPSLLVAQNADIYYRKRSGEVDRYENVRLISDGYKEVEARAGAARYKLAPEDVVKIVFRSVPRELTDGMQSFEDGDFKEAAANLQKFLENRRGKDYDVYAQYYFGRSLRALGYLDQAAEAFQAVIEADRKHRLVPDSYNRLAEIAMLRGKAGAPQATRYFETLKKLADSERITGGFALTAERGLATIEARFGDPSKALSQLQDLLTRASDSETERTLINLQIGNVYNRQKDYERAENVFQSVVDRIDSSTAPEVIALACNGLGDSQYYREQHDKAMVTYSRTYALFFDRVDLVGEVAHALYYGAKAFQLQAGLEKDDDRKSLLRRRATKLLRRASSDRFAATAPGKMARRDLGL